MLIAECSFVEGLQGSFVAVPIRLFRHPREEKPKDAKLQIKAMIMLH